MGASMPNPSIDHRSFVFGNQDFAWKQFETALRWNAQAFTAYSTVGSELQRFIARRINEDFALVRKVSQCRTPHDHVVACADYWRKAAEDYAEEVTRLGKLTTSATSKMVAAAHPAIGEEGMLVKMREAAE
jgi:Phasin protein